MQPASASQLNLQTSADQQRISDNASVVSFSSVAASHQNLDTKVDMVSSLLSMLGTHDKDDVARTLLAMSSSTDSCSAMRQSGCLPLLIKLLHDPEYEVKGINWEARHRAGMNTVVSWSYCLLLYRIWNSLPSSCFPNGLDLQSFKSFSNCYILSLLYFQFIHFILTYL